MATVDVTVTLRVDGQTPPGFPLTRKITTTEAVSFDYQKASGGGYATLPVSDIASLAALIVRSDQAVTLRLDAQSDAGIELNADGMLIILDAVINAGASTNATISNASGSTATVKGWAAGA